MQKAGAELGALLVQRAIDALGIDGAAVNSYGKAAIVGENGEREHAAAVMHPRMGRPVREIVGPAKSIMPSTKKMGGPGTVIDCPLHHKDDIWKFSHFDAMQVSVVGRAARRRNRGRGGGQRFGPAVPPDRRGSGRFRSDVQERVR